MVMKKSFLAAQLVLAIFMLMLLPGQVSAADNYIEGLSIQIEDYPDEVRVGETFTMTVRVVNESGQQADALLRTYLYGDMSVIAYPPPDFRTPVLLNENGWYPNETPVTLWGNENEVFTLSLTVKSDIQLVNDSPGLVRVRARIRRIENDTSIDLAPPDNRVVTLRPKAGPEGIVGIKLGVGVAVAAAIVYSFVNIQKHNNRNTRKRTRG